MNEKELLERIVEKFNEMLEGEGSFIRLQLDTRVYGTVDIKMIESPYVDSYVLNLSNAFYEKLESFLRDEFGIEQIGYNNTKSCFCLV